MERQTNQFNHYLTQLLKTDNRDELERIAFDAASFLGFEYLAYLPFAPMQQDKQRIINIPKTFTEAYKKHNWLSNDMLLERAAYERGHFYMSESMVAIQQSPFYGGHKIHQCQNMVAAFKAMVCPDALYIP
ncbi:MAG: autoinducer binding domain-containing protein, partial [Pseudomonadales bacterium]|nr:autoinducer binding domain-containing protein [Pseudomonadales bacterium]